MDNSLALCTLSPPTALSCCSAKCAAAVAVLAALPAPPAAERAVLCTAPLLPPPAGSPATSTHAGSAEMAGGVLEAGAPHEGPGEHQLYILLAPPRGWRLLQAEKGGGWVGWAFRRMGWGGVDV